MILPHVGVVVLLFQCAQRCGIDDTFASQTHLHRKNALVYSFQDLTHAAYVNDPRREAPGLVKSKPVVVQPLYRTAEAAD